MTSLSLHYLHMRDTTHCRWYWFFFSKIFPFPGNLRTLLVASSAAARGLSSWDRQQLQRRRLQRFASSSAPVHQTSAIVGRFEPSQIIFLYLLWTAPISSVHTECAALRRVALRCGIRCERTNSLFHGRHLYRRTDRLVACRGNHDTPFTRYNRLSVRFDNRFDNRLYRVNGAWENVDAFIIFSSCGYTFTHDVALVRI